MNKFFCFNFSTNPSSTAIFKCLLSLKTRNGIIICPHPRALNCTIEAARIVVINFFSHL